MFGADANRQRRGNSLLAARRGVSGEELLLNFKPGSRWHSAVCDTSLIVVRPPTEAGRLECGGHPMREADQAAAPRLQAAAERLSGTQIGKRYQDEPTGLELICAKGGVGSLSYDGRLLTLKSAKPLPSSD